STMIGSASVDSSGHAIVTTQSLSIGDHAISAKYSGDDFLVISRSVTHRVTKAAVTTKVNSSANPALVQQGVLLSVSVTGEFGGIPSGTLTFAEGANVLASAPLNASGQAEFSKSDWSAGPHNLTISYSGDAKFFAG